MKIIKEILKWLLLVLLFPIALGLTYGIVRALECLYNWNPYVLGIGIISICFGTYLYVDMKL